MGLPTSVQDLPEMLQGTEPAGPSLESRLAAAISRRGSLTTSQGNCHSRPRFPLVHDPHSMRQRMHGSDGATSARDASEFRLALYERGRPPERPQRVHAPRMGQSGAGAREVPDVDARRLLPPSRLRGPSPAVAGCACESARMGIAASTGIGQAALFEHARLLSIPGVIGIDPRIAAHWATPRKSLKMTFIYRCQVVPRPRSTTCVLADTFASRRALWGAHLERARSQRSFPCN